MSANRLEGLIENAREELLRAIKLSKQGSYERRAPAPASLIHFETARSLLDEILLLSPRNTEALLMKSQISEGLLDFDSAIIFLNSAFDAGEARSQKLLKRLALLRENAKAWKALAMSPFILRQLGDYLESCGVGPANRTMELTKKWLDQNMPETSEKVIVALEERGAYSDFQVLANVVYG